MPLCDCSFWESLVAALLALGSETFGNLTIVVNVLVENPISSAADGIRGATGDNIGLGEAPPELRQVIQRIYHGIELDIIASAVYEP